jgi:PAS domain S-box-containing protein
VLSVVLLAAIFLADISLPLGVAGGVPYVAVVLISLWSRRKRFTLVAAATASVLTVLGYFFSPPAGIAWMVLVNRFLALFVIWVTVLLGLLHKGAEDKVRESETRYRTLFEQSPDAILIVDPETTLPIDFNDRMLSLLGYSQEEFAKLRVSDYEALESSEETRAHIDRVIREGEDEFETKLRTKEGKIKDVLVNAQTIGISGRIAFHNIVRDITDRKRLQLYESILPICSACGKVRDDTGTERGKGSWESLQTFVIEHSDTSLSHTLCPPCYQEYRQQQGLPPEEP